MTTLLADLRFGTRLLRRHPGFSAISLLVLAIGIGANTAAFSLVNVLLLKPRVGGVDAELSGVYSRHRSRPDDYRAFSFAEFEALRGRADVLPHVAAHGFGMVGLDDGGRNRRVFVDIVTAGFFETFGVAPVLGRAFTRDEERPGAGIPVAIVSYPLFRRLGGTSDVVGRTLDINARPYTVVGVAPESFGGSMVMVTPELWLPTGVYDDVAFDLRNAGGGSTLADGDFRELIVVARVDPATPPAAVNAALAAISDAQSLASPDTHGDYRLELAPLSRLSVSTRPQVDDELTGLTAVMLSLSGIVLLVASFNLANMLLARGRLRQREFAIRLAVGGSRARLVRQLVTEGLLLAGLGALGGLVVATVGTRLLFLMLPPVLPISLTFDTTPDVRVLAATAAAAVLAALLFSLLPAWRVARRPALPDLRQQSAEGWTGRRGRFGLRTGRDWLVAAQLALTLVMMSVAGLFVRGALDAARSDPGFTLDRGILVNLDAGFAGYDVPRTRQFYADAIDRLAALPGVADAGLASHMPFGEIQEGRSFQRQGAPVPLDAPDRAARVVGATSVSISDGYFAAVGIPILAGRDFTAAEAFADNGEPLAIIDETLATRLFEGEEAVGQFIQTGGGADAEPTVLRVIGVAGGIRADLFESAPSAFVYQPFGRMFRSNVYLHARTTLPDAEAEAAFLPVVRQALSELAPDVTPVSLETRPMFRERNLLLAILRTGAGLFAAFGLAALLLAAVGLYGVKAYLVSSRTREFGVRMALGASPRSVVGLVLREGLVPMAAGLIAGTGLSILAGQLVRGWLFQGRALDLPVVLLATLALVAAVLAATWVPARRATSVQPVRALRTE